MCETITSEEKLSITGRYLATGEIFESLTYQFRVHQTTITKFVPKVCEQMYLNLKDIYLKIPNETSQWEAIAPITFERYQFPNCICAADCKHVALIHPFSSGSEFYSYKRFFIVVMLALVEVVGQVVSVCFFLGYCQIQKKQSQLL